MTERKNTSISRGPDRRTVILTGMTTLALPLTATPQTQTHQQGDMTMGAFTAKDGTNIFYKDWGPKDAQPTVFHHG